MYSISGPEAFSLIKEIKSNYGVKQNSIAAVLGISRQAITDMKAGRRRFTQAMAQKMLQTYADEPWIGWLHDRLDALFTPPSTRFIIPGELPPRGESGDNIETPSLSVPSEREAINPIRLPILTLPCKGVPEASPANTQKLCVIPDELLLQTSELSNSYVLIIDFDSRDGRLRRGDRVLVVQDAGREVEIMVIEYRGTLRLARRGKYERVFNRSDVTVIDDMDWVFMDSVTVIPVGDATAVGSVIGIVMALL